QLAALSRASIPESLRIPFYVYLDECHSFVNMSIADILSEARKYKLSLFLTHQYSSQLAEGIRSAIIGNCGTLICFRSGTEDAIWLAKEFYPTFSETDIINLPKYGIYLKLMIGGLRSQPFSATTITLKENLQSFKEEVLQHCRQKFGR